MYLLVLVASINTIFFCWVMYYLAYLCDYLLILRLLYCSISLIYFAPKILFTQSRDKSNTQILFYFYSLASYNIIMNLFGASNSTVSIVMMTMTMMMTGTEVEACCEWSRLPIYILLRVWLQLFWRYRFLHYWFILLILSFLSFLECHGK